MRDWVRDARLEKGMTQRQVADASGISESFYSQIETDQRNPSPQHAQSIARALGLDWTRFYRETDPT